ncbi:MAG TPA: hypothetical protein PKC29_04400 [Thermodesulfobacteriota bacterium]|nr:hypothetical protein [Thermodesulfobacteriota bacterium]
MNIKRTTLGRRQNPAAIFVAILLGLFVIIGCDSSNHGSDAENFCYLESSPDPCFDPNADGSTVIVTDLTVEEVITEQEGLEGFEEQLPVTNILEQIGFPAVPPPVCPSEQNEPVVETSSEQNELVIKTNEDWNRFRDSCFFSFFELPDVDFSSSMVLVSTQDFAQLGASVEAVLVFEDHLTAVIEDDISTVPVPGPGYPFNIVSIPRSDLPVDFIRVENYVSPFVP